MGTDRLIDIAFYAKNTNFPYFYQICEISDILADVYYNTRSEVAVVEEYERIRWDMIHGENRHTATGSLYTSTYLYINGNAIY